MIKIPQRTKFSQDLKDLYIQTNFAGSTSLIKKIIIYKCEIIKVKHFESMEDAVSTTNKKNAIFETGWIYTIGKSTS